MPSSKPKSRLTSSSSTSKKSTSTTLPPPFKPAPSALTPFTSTLPPNHVYITHIDPRPAAFKRRIFLVPVALNVAVTALFLWRVYSVAPYYAALLASTFGYPNATTLRAADLSWAELARVILRRSLTFLLDFVLAVFVWPWPYEFVFGGGGAGKTRAWRASPVLWRWSVGFREKEVYVRRSRESWDWVLVSAEPPSSANREGGGGGGGAAAAVDLFDARDPGARQARDAVLGRVRVATAPMALGQKTGYLTMDGEWDLDWQGMMDVTRLVDKKEVPLEALGTVVLLHHERFGWVTVDLGVGETAEQDERRKQVLAFRDALAAIGKEDLFFRWVEMIQFETTQPGGFTQEKQVEAAKKIRDMFKENGVDFDEFWKQTVGTEGLAGMP